MKTKKSNLIFMDDKNNIFIYSLEWNDKKVKSFIQTKNTYLECLEPEKLHCNILDQVDNDQIFLVGEL